ncbi:response regulator [Microbacterium sp. 179-I 3D4 NHS]|uniref:response regulator n=1 Tax=Microbacterium sp. 179-I 3D4 NHS TaxID=3142381 RepID=UPI00399F5311
MALARLHGGPLDGQIIPLGDADDKLIVPYSETQVVYNRRGEPQNTGTDDGPTEIDYWFDEALENLTTTADDD